MPKLTVLIPTYNYARFLPDALDSVLGQTFRDFELLVIDDASSDNTRQVLEQYATRDPRVRFHIQNRNSGMVQNWNTGLQMASGDYIKFLFADDKLCSVSALDQMVQAIEHSKTISLVMTGRRILDDASREKHVVDAGMKGVEPGPAVIARCLEITRNILGEPSASLFPTRLAQRGFNPRYRQLVDLEFWFHLLEQGDLFYIPDPLCGFRIHDAQQTAANRMQQVDAAEYRELLETYFPKPYLREFIGDRFLFNNVYALRRSRGNAAPSELECKLRKQMNAPGFAWQWLRYKISRPIDNLRRSMRKRFGR
ncbi:MAG: glycosyltransferase family 2 protein [Limisphaerales bacterium]